MITPRRTRLVRVADLHAFRAAIAALTAANDFSDAASPVSSPGSSDKPGAAPCAVIVPTRGAAGQLHATLHRINPAAPLPLLLTRDGLYDTLHARLVEPPRRLTVLERDSLAQAAAHHAAAEAPDLPFKVRPGLVAEILRFYDQLRRQAQQVKRFEELIVEALGGSDGDRGAERLLRQTRFIAGTFREYERRAAATGACDEHTLRDILIRQPAAAPLSHVIVTQPDWIADPAGLFVADFNLLARLPDLEALDIVCTEAVLATGFHERVHNWWPGLEEVEASALLGVRARVRPTCAVPADADGVWWFTRRDREEELIACAGRLVASAIDPSDLDRAAIVFKQPLPYLYLAPEVFRDAGLRYRVSDALPLAAEPVAAALDLLLEAVETRFARAPVIALLRSPHFPVDRPLPRAAASALDRAMSDSRYLGEPARLEQLASTLSGEAAAAMEVALSLTRDLSPLVEAAPASVLVSTLLAFLQCRLVPLNEDDPLAAREQAGRTAVCGLLAALADAHARHFDPIWTFEELAAAIRRSIGEETFAVQAGETGIHLIDDQAARYGDFDDLTVVGLIENEWPERPRRNIFYPPTLLKALGWPSEKDRRAAADARFLDLIASARHRVELSTFTLEDEALVTRSLQLDEVPRAGLSSVARTEPAVTSRSFTGDWAELRSGRSAATAVEFHGTVGQRPARSWSVSALETYLGCPFKFYAQHVLRLTEEPDDEEVMDPRRQGQFVHEVFESFFAAWGAAGHRGITSSNLDSARALFVQVVDRALERLSDGEAGLERTRLLGSSAAAGLGDAVFRMEAERPVAVVERLLEHRFDGAFTIATDAGPRVVQLRGKADRVDLLADGTFRLIDYKLGWPPDCSKALQLPIYALLAEQRLAGHRGRRWTLGEAMYLAFKGPRRVVPLFASPANRADTLVKAQQRLADTLDAIAEGSFPPSPDDVYRCETCSFSAVCRKDYVGNV